MVTANKKVNTNHLPQFRRPYKAPSLGQCLCRSVMKQFIIFFLHCLIALEHWHRLFCVAMIDQVPPRSVAKILGIFFKGFGNKSKRKVPYQVVILCLIWFLWLEMDARAFEDKQRSMDAIRDSILLFLFPMGLSHLVFC